MESLSGWPSRPHADVTRKGFIATACLTAGFYLTLSWLTLLCVATHVDHPGSQHNESHSPFCFWFSKTNSSVGVVSLALSLLVVLVFIFLVDTASIVFVGIPSSFHFPRGPPTR